MADPIAPKPIYLSKTFWLQILAIVVVLVPKANEFVSQYFGMDNAAVGWGLINIILRLVSKGKVEIV